MKINEYNIPDDLYYNKEHEWIRIEKEGLVRIGITDYAQEMLREISIIYFLEDSLAVKRSETICTVQSVKAVSEIYSPFTGEIVDFNEKLSEKPTIINEDPYGDGWIAVIHPSRIRTELKKLVKPKKYASYIKKLIKIDENLLIYRWKQ